MKRLATFALGALLLASPLPAAPPDPEPSPAAMLRALGVAPDKADRLAAAFDKAIETEDAAALRPFLADPDAPVVQFAALLGFQVDPAGTRRAILGHLDSGDANTPALLVALCFDDDPEAVDYLVGWLRGEQDAAWGSLVRFSLRVLTGQRHTAAADWGKWWQGSRESFEFREPGDPAEQERRMRDAAADLGLERLGTLAGVLAKTPKSGADQKPGPLAGILDGLARAHARGRDLRSSPDEEAADALFASGRFDEAERAYARLAATPPGDSRSRFLRGCLLFELDRLDEAAREFATLAETGSPAAKFLLALTRRRQRQPGEALLEAARAELRDLPPPDEFSLAGWKDELLENLFAETTAGRGPYHLDPDRLAAFVAAHPEDPDAAVGAALAGRNDQRTLALELARERFPDALLPLIAVAAEKAGGSSGALTSEALALLSAWSRQEPDNAFPLLLLAVGRHDMHTTLDEHQKRRRSPLPADGVAEVGRALALPRLDSGSAALTEATRRALAGAGFPFRLGLIGVPERFEGGLMKLVQSLSDAADEALDAKRDAEAAGICRLLESFGERRRQGTRGVMARMTASLAVWQGHARRRKLLVEAGRAPEADALKAGDDRERAALRDTAKTTDLRLCILPIPSLQTACVEHDLQPGGGE